MLSEAFWKPEARRDLTIHSHEYEEQLVQKLLESLQKENKELRKKLETV